MHALLCSTIALSFFDSLNPSAMLQQVFIQATVKKKSYIWFFILGIGLANFLMGLAIYYGVAAYLLMFWEFSISKNPFHIRWIEVFAGICFVVIGLRMFLKIRLSSVINGEPPMKIKNSQLTPIPLFLMGAAFCFVELTSALPYFGFLAILATYKLATPYVLGMVFLYTVIYAAPLILLYFSYNKLQGTSLITWLELALNKVSAYILPVAVVSIGALLLLDGILYFLL